mmetsp:Transcript_114438/g.363728  ORF Transcript_114438/g.363728 Transcript_114438/m.363728 type:complete len:131 (-) Transcript_114438:190-582(-)
MATGSPLFPGDSEIGTIYKIFEKLGTPTVEEWPGLMELPQFKPSFPKWPRKGWENIRNTKAHGLRPAAPRLRTHGTAAPLLCRRRAAAVSGGRAPSRSLGMAHRRGQLGVVLVQITLHAMEVPSVHTHQD